MALQALNVSVVEVSAGCVGQGNLSVEVSDYNISCTNSSVLSRPSSKVRGRISFLLSARCLWRVTKADVSNASDGIPPARRQHLAAHIWV